MKKIIHMSDLHVGYQDNAERFYRIIEGIKAQMSDGILRIQVPKAERVLPRKISIV